MAIAVNLAAVIAVTLLVQVQPDLAAVLVAAVVTQRILADRLLLAAVVLVGIQVLAAAVLLVKEHRRTVLAAVAVLAQVPTTVLAAAAELDFMDKVLTVLVGRFLVAALVPLAVVAALVGRMALQVVKVAALVVDQVVHTAQVGAETATKAAQVKVLELTVLCELCGAVVLRSRQQMWGRKV